MMNAAVGDSSMLPDMHSIHERGKVNVATNYHCKELHCS